MESTLDKHLLVWSLNLNKDNEWTRSLEEAFDRVGFYDPDDWVPQTMPEKVKGVKDDLWGMIDLDPLAQVIVDSPIFQRLRFIHQNGLTYLTYPTARHTRFEHSLGVYCVVNRLLESIHNSWRVGGHGPRKATYMAEEAKRDAFPTSLSCATRLRLAALLHDIGHSAFSHASEAVFANSPDKFRIGPFTVREFLIGINEVLKNFKTSKSLSEVLSCAVILSERFTKFFARAMRMEIDVCQSELAKIACLILGEACDPKDQALPNIISGAVDADKIDYIARDAKRCGISTNIDLHRVFFRVSVVESNAGQMYKGDLPEGLSSKDDVRVLVIDPSGYDTIRELGASRLSLYQRIYQHPFTRRAELYLEKTLHAVVDRAGENTHGALEGEYSSFGDLLYLWASPEQTVLGRAATLLHDDAHHRDAQGNHARRILYRALPKRAAPFGASRVAQFEPPVAVEDIDQTEYDRSISKVPRRSF